LVQLKVEIGAGKFAIAQKTQTAPLKLACGLLHFSKLIEQSTCLKNSELNHGGTETLRKTNKNSVPLCLITLWTVV
jgi:hypothetical protein